MRAAALCLALALACGPLQAQEIRPGVAAEKKERKESRPSTDSSKRAPAAQQPAPVKQAPRVQQPSRPAPAVKPPVATQPAAQSERPKPGVAVDRLERQRLREQAERSRSMDLERSRPQVVAPAPAAPSAAPIRPAAAPEPPKTPPAQQVVRCSASPSCASGEICRDVAQTYAGGNVFNAGRQDIIRLCQRVNAASPCCAQQCAPSAQCAR